MQPSKGKVSGRCFAILLKVYKDETMKCCCCCSVYVVYYSLKVFFYLRDYTLLIVDGVKGREG